MEKRFSQRTSSKFLAAAVASVGLMGMAASQSDAGLVIDVRATNAGTGGVLGAGGKSVTAVVGSTVVLGVFARISGTNSVQQIGDFQQALDINGDPVASVDTRNDDSLQTLTGSFNSVGSLTGNLNSVAGQLTYNSRTTPFNAPGSSNGIASDWDTDGDLDIGANSTDPTNMFVGRAGGNAAATLLDNHAGGTAKGWSIGVGTSAANGNDSILSATTSELQVGTIRFVVTGSSGTSTVGYVQRLGGDPGVLWFEDGSATGKTPLTGTFSIAPGVAISVPEPASLGLLGVAGLGLLGRRRNKKA